MSHGLNSLVPVIGELYGYRARAVDGLVPVTVLKEGTKKPARVLVRFEDPAMEGREEWVPPARLKVEWTGVDAYRAEEARWEAVFALSPSGESAEVNAAEQVCDLLIDDTVATFGYRDAHLEVTDLAWLGEAAGVEEEFVTSHPAGFTDEGTVIVPWPVAVEVIKRVLVHDPDPVLAVIAQEEAKARYEAIHGHRFTSSGGNRHEYYVDPERCVEYDQESAWGAPKRGIFRDWAGEATHRWDELVELRKEIKRVGEVAEATIAALRSHGHTREADRFATELGMTVEMLRNEGD